MPEISTADLLYAIKDNYGTSTYETSQDNNTGFIMSLSKNDVQYAFDGSVSLCSEY